MREKPIVCEGAGALRMRRAGQSARTTSTAAPGHQGMASGGHSAKGVAGLSLASLRLQLPQGSHARPGQLGGVTPFIGLVSVALLWGGVVSKENPRMPPCLAAFSFPCFLCDCSAATLAATFSRSGHGEPNPTQPGLGWAGAERCRSWAERPALTVAGGLSPY